MHDGLPMTWREVADKHHAALVDELGQTFDASIRAAVSSAIEEVRGETQNSLNELRTDFEIRFEAALGQARQATDDALKAQAFEAEKRRLSEIEKLRAEAHQSLGEVRASFDRAREAERDQTRRTTQQALAEQWNQALRRLRQLSTQEEVLAFLADATAPYAERAVVVVFQNVLAIPAASRAIPDARLSSFPTAQAPAIESVIATRDPVVSLSSENELSPALYRMLQPAVGEKAYLFPVRGRQAVTAVLATHGTVVAAALELLCEAAGFQLDVISKAGFHATQEPEETAAPQHPAVSEFVQIDMAPAAPIAAPAPVPLPITERKAWDELNAGEQRIHLQAQRFARVQVAEMRLYKADAVRTGVDRKNVYLSLRMEIDEARQQFLQRFLSISPNMVDYLHLEILRSLVHDDDRLLGHEYPGPMV